MHYGKCASKEHWVSTNTKPSQNERLDCSFGQKIESLIKLKSNIPLSFRANVNVGRDDYVSERGRSKERGSVIWQCPLSAVTYGPCTLLVSRGNTSHECICSQWAACTSSIRAPSIRRPPTFCFSTAPRLSVCLSVLPHSRSLHLPIIPAHCSSHQISRRNRGPLHPGLHELWDLLSVSKCYGKNMPLFHRQRAISGATGQSDSVLGRKNWLCTL